MKKAILLIAFILPFIASSQNFILKDGSIIWQRVYEGTPQIQLLSDVVKLDSTITGKIERHVVNYTKQGYVYRNVPVLIRENTVNSDVIYDLKQGKYRVTLTNIVLTNTLPGLVGSPSTAESYFLKNGEFSSRRLILNTMEILNTDLTGLFAPKTPDTDKW